MEITDEQKEEMIKMRDLRITYREIGEHFHISKQRVHQIIGPRKKV